MKQKFTSTIAGASIFISLIGVLSRGFGFIREMIFANNFGTGTEFDLYLVGAVLPVTINTIILYVGQNFFVPGFQKVSSSDAVTSKNYYRKSFILFFAAGMLLAILLFVTSEIVINFYMYNADLESKAIASTIFNIFLATIPFSAGISMLSALLQAKYEFRYPSISTLFLNISVIVMLLLFTNSIGIYVIPIGYVIGTIFQFIFLMYKSRLYFELKSIFNLDEIFKIKSIFSSVLLTIILIESISQLYSIFDRLFYSSIKTGGIASLNYAMIILILPISIFSISLTTVIFPKISAAINKNSANDIEKIHNESISMNTLIFMPIAFVFFFFGDTLITFFFQRGKFVEESTIMTFNVLKYYSLSLVFYSVYAVFNKIFYSVNLAKLLLLISIIGILIKLTLNFILIDLEQTGLALSTSISFFYFFISSYLVLLYKLKINHKLLFVQEFSIHFINCLICLLIISIISSFISDTLLINLLTIILFFMICLLNLMMIKHRSIIVLSDVIKRLTFNR